jgi:hypothetical protein
MAMNERPGYGDAEAKRIMDRAAEIDVEEARRLDAPALREIAAQAGISPLAVDRALHEHESGRPAQLPWLKRHRALLIVILVVVAFVLYAFARRIAP